MIQTISRTSFLAAIEKGIADAHGADATPRFWPRNWRSKLREVGKTATETSITLFDSCPITLAGFAEFPMEDARAWAFIDGFDGALRDEYRPGNVRVVG